MSVYAAIKSAVANRPERPHAHNTTGTLVDALARTSKDARRYAQTGPKAAEDLMHHLADEFLDELQARGELFPAAPAGEAT